MEREAKTRRADIHALASLISVAFHDPKKMPRAADFVEGRARARFSSDHEIDHYFRRLAAVQAAKGGK